MSKVVRRSANKSNGHPSQVSERFGEYVMLAVAILSTDGTYQRPLSPWRVRDIVLNFIAILFQPLIVGKRDGIYYVIDGQHRLEAAKQMGFTEVPCMVYITASVEEEAKAFVQLQQFRRRITPQQKFVARLAYKDVAAVTISELLTKYSFEIGDYDGFSGNNHKNNRISAIAQVERAYDEGGEKRVDDLLYILRHAWDGRAAALERSVIRGLSKFMNKNPYGHKALADRLKEADPYTIRLAALSVSRAQGLDESDAYAAVIGNLYRGAPLKAKVK